MSTFISKPNRIAVYNIFLEVLEGWSSPPTPLSPNDAVWADWWHPDGHRVWWDGINGRFGFVRANDFNADLFHFVEGGRGWKSKLKTNLTDVVEKNTRDNSDLQQEN